MTTDDGLQIGRRIKARRLAETVVKLGGVQSDVARLSDAEWSDLDFVSRGLKLPKRPVSPETRALVAEILAQWPRDEDAPCPSA